MDDLISRSAVLEILSNEFDMAAEERSEADNEKDRAFNAGEINCARRSTRKVKELPAVDAVPVVHARWIERDMWYTDMQCDCSACGAKLHVPTCMGKPMYKYCPDCGARMDGEENAAD